MITASNIVNYVLEGPGAVQAVSNIVNYVLEGPPSYQLASNIVNYVLEGPPEPVLFTRRRYIPGVQ